MFDELTEALAAHPVDDRDQAAAELALTYAREIDQPACAECERVTDLARIGPALLAALDALHLTTRARAAVKKRATDGPTNPLDQLAARRAGRGRAPSVDSPVEGSV